MNKAFKIKNKFVDFIFCVSIRLRACMCTMDIPGAHKGYGWLLVMVTGNGTQVLWKTSKCSGAKPPAAPDCLPFLFVVCVSCVTSALVLRLVFLRGPDDTNESLKERTETLGKVLCFWTVPHIHQFHTVETE